jgi:hypothetical protein
MQRNTNVEEVSVRHEEILSSPLTDVGNIQDSGFSERLKPGVATMSRLLTTQCRQKVTRNPSFLFFFFFKPPRFISVSY